MTSTTGDSVTGNKTFASAVIGWALVVVLAVSGGAYLYTNAADNNNQATVVNTLTERVDTLTAENKAISTRLGICLGSFKQNRAYALENKAMMQQISDKWGVNYRTPVKDTMTAFQTLSDSLECN